MFYISVHYLLFKKIKKYLQLSKISSLFVKRAAKSCYKVSETMNTAATETIAYNSGNTARIMVFPNTS